MYSEELENLIEIAIEDGELTEKKQQILMRRAQSEGVDLDEFEMVLESRLTKKRKEKESMVSQVVTPPPTSSKYGDMKKCPSCGAAVVGGSAVCHECGYSFSGISATKSSVQLYEELLRFDRENVNKKTAGGSALRFAGKLVSSSMVSNDGADRDTVRRKMDIIINFPVPNTREDLLDFLTSIRPKANGRAPKDGIIEEKQKGSFWSGDRSKTNKEDLGYAYYLLYLNCINKAKVNFTNDPAFKPYIG